MHNCNQCCYCLKSTLALIQYTGCGTSSWHNLNAYKIKIKRYIPILMVPLDSLNFFSNNFGECVVLILLYQLPFFWSGRFPGMMNWTGAQLDLVSLSSVLEVWNPFQNWNTHRNKIYIYTYIFVILKYVYHGILKCNQKTRFVDVIDFRMQYACFVPVQFNLPGNRRLWRNGKW